jgi:hypothetical protein
MYRTNITKAVLSACLLLLAFGSRAQDAESVRARNFMTLRRLLNLKAIAPSYLTAADLTQIQVLQGQTQTQICLAVTTASCQPVILPITGLKLAGRRTNTEKVQLNWETLSEFNSSGFVLERQSFYNASHYDSLMFVASAGNSASKRKYAYTDLNSYNSTSYYRVKQIDTDGKTTYSNVVMIEGYTGKPEISVAPNPVTGGAVKVYITGLGAAQSFSLVVSSSTGKQLIKKEHCTLNGGYIELNTKLLAAGYYFVAVYTSSGVYSRSFTVVD